MDLFKDAVEKLKDKISNDPLTKLLNEATSDVNWNASNRILQEIANHTHSFGELTEVMKFIRKRLGSETKQWRKTLKTLNLIEYLMKNGSPQCVKEFQRDVYLIRNLQYFSHSEGGQDRGAAIREMSKRIVQVLGDEERINEERKKAQEIRDCLNRNFNSTSGTEVRKTKDWRVEKPGETSSKVGNNEKEEVSVERVGTKYHTNTSNTGEKQEQEDKAVLKKKLVPPKGMKVPAVQQQEEVDFLGIDTANSEPKQRKSDNIWNWEQEQRDLVKPTESLSSNLVCELNEIRFNTPSTSGDLVVELPPVKSTAPVTDEYKNYSQQEKSIIDLSEMAGDFMQKKTQRGKAGVAEDSNGRFLHSTNEDLDDLMSNMQGGFNSNMNQMGGFFMGGVYLHNS